MVNNFIFGLIYLRWGSGVKVGTKKEIIIFFIITFGGSFLVGIPFNLKHQYLSYFQAMIMMFLPAVGVIVAKRKKIDDEIYNEFAILYLLGMCVCLFSVGAYLLGISEERTTTNIIDLVVGIQSISTIIIMREKLKIIESIKKLKVTVCGFVFLEICISLIGVVGNILDYGKELTNIITQMLVSFVLSISLGVGEELGWRGFLQEKMQKKFGLKTGVILLGLLWEIWHIPLWFTQYNLSIYEIGLRFLMTISFSIFLGYVYMKTENVWMCALFHILVNIFSGRFEMVFSYKKIFLGRSLSEIIQIIFMLSLGMFIFSKEYKSD